MTKFIDETNESYKKGTQTEFAKYLDGRNISHANCHPGEFDKVILIRRTKNRV